jgi:hypothetical protein
LCLLTCTCTSSWGAGEISSLCAAPARGDAMRGALLDAIKIMAATATAFMVVLQMNSL